MDLEKICLETCDLVHQVGELIKNEVDKLSDEDIEAKGIHDYVTYVDKMSETLLAKGLGSILPHAGILAEEGTVGKKGEQFRWVIDPLDGTTNFIHALPVYSISVALMDGDKVVIGVVYEINQRECFYAWTGSNAFMNGQAVHTSTTRTLDNSLLATGFPYTDYGHMEDYLQLLGHLLKNSRGLRRFGSAAVDLAYVACGRFEGFYEYGLNPWDVAAGSLIVQQAGGTVSDFKGSDHYIYGKEIIASNSFVHTYLLDAFRKYFVKMG